MHDSLGFLVGLLDSTSPGFVAWEDFSGRHGRALRLCQQLGFVASEPCMHPAPSCPHCGEGIPCRIGGQCLCNCCHSRVDEHHLQAWPLQIDAFLHWIAAKLRLQGEVHCIGDQLWHLGSKVINGFRHEIFYRRSTALTEAEKDRLSALRNTVVLHGLCCPQESEGTARSLSLLNVLSLGRALLVADLSELLVSRGRVVFDATSGVIRAGHETLGEVPVGSKEFFFLQCLARQVDVFVPYSDIKHFVLQHSGSVDGTEEATFCQLLKSRIKKKWVPDLNRLIGTSNKGDGYRLRGML